VSFDFPAEEQVQAEADRKYWGKRLTSIPEEKRTEPERIRAGYTVRACRLDPAGLVYLWPVSG